MKTPILDAIVGGIARALHPDKPRSFFADWKFPTDISADDVAAALDVVAKANPQFRNWRTSWVDLLKLTHPDDPDGASDMTNRTRLAAELGDTDYKGSAEDNIRLHALTLKALQQRGIRLPSAA